MLERLRVGMDGEATGRGGEMSVWPKRIEMTVPQGTMVLESHAPWCPQEKARIALSGSSEGSVIFQGFAPECRCAVSDTETIRAVL